MSSKSIRPLAICVFWNAGKILVSEGYDPIKKLKYYRPLGGGIEFGETSAQTVEREIREEINAEITNLRLIGTLENIFTYLGAPGHEIVQVYDGKFLDQTLYTTPAIIGAESRGQPFQAHWLSLDCFTEETPLFPDGLQQLLQSKVAYLEATA